MDIRYYFLKKYIKSIILFLLFISKVQEYKYKLN